MKKIDIYEPYVNFRCQKLRASMRKMAQSDWSRCSPNWLSNLMWTPQNIFKDNNTSTKRTVRRYPQSGLNGFGLWSTRNKWFSGLGLNPSSDELA